MKDEQSRICKFSSFPHFIKAGILCSNFGMIGDSVLPKKGKVLGSRAREDLLGNRTGSSSSCFSVTYLHFSDMVSLPLSNTHLLKGHLGIKVEVEDPTTHTN